MRAAKIVPLTLASPALSGAAFYAWLQYSPKSWVDPACGFQTWELLATLPLLAAGVLAPGVYAVKKNAGWLTTAATAVMAGILTVGACLTAFLLWFGQHMCGE